MEPSQPGNDADPGDLELEVRQAFEREIAEGETVFDVGDPAEGFYVVRDGEVELRGDESSAGTPRVMARLGPGDTLGEAEALLGRPRSHKAVAVSAARLIQLDRNVFDRMCLERPQITVRILERLATRISDLERRLAVLGMDDLVRPMVRSLLELAEPDGDGVRASCSLRTLADRSGLTLRQAHRALQELFERKLVRLVDDALLVPDRLSLAACLDGAADTSGAAR